MESLIKVTFAGNKKVNAEFEGHIIKTDQPLNNGGENSAPSPFNLFLASIATCAGIYVNSFCTQRNIPMEGIELLQKMIYNPQKKLIDKIILEISLPRDFPEKYKEPLINVVNLCTVKKHLANPPEIETMIL